MALPAAFASTREALHALACYAIAPARKARTGRIGLRPTGEGFGTPPFDDGTRIVVRGNALAIEPGEEIVVTTVRAAGAFLGVTLTPDPGVGTDLPPFEPDALLDVDVDASVALGRWYGMGQSVLDQLPSHLGERAPQRSPRRNCGPSTSISPSTSRWPVAVTSTSASHPVTASSTSPTCTSARRT